MLQHFGVIPFLIFDGDYLPSKAATEADRAKRRDESRKAGQELLNAGKTSQAYLEFQKAVDVTPEMARQLIDELRKSGVQYIVAPYEADAQMVYLERKGIIDGILSEDSDLLVFGAKCLLTKLDQYGNCIEINKADFCACREISLTGWSDTEFRCMAILSGCDYLNSITNMGLKTAYRMVRKHKTIEKVIRMLQFDGKFFVPKDYLEAFREAELTFLHQRVFCPQKLTLVFHTEPERPIDEQRMPFIGAYVEPEIAQGVARGDLNPITKLPIVSQNKVKMSVPTTPTPWTSRAQPQQSNSTNDLKKGESIDTFFKPKRIPLGELDINCFTVSPSQQQALERNRGPWLANPVMSRQYLNSAATESPQLPQLSRSAPPAARATTRRTHIRTPTISEPRPPKRPRLCADIESDSPSQDPEIELGRSRFFASAAPEPSPTVGRNGRGKKSKKQDINIFSDDSVEEVMRNLPDADGFGAGAKIAIFEEEKSKNDGDANSQPASIQDPAETDGSQASPKTIPGLTPSMSRASSAEQLDPPTPVTDTRLPHTIEKLKDAFSFTPTGASTPKSNTAVKGFQTPSSSASRPSRIPLAVKFNTSDRSAHTTAKPSVLTPLQRLAASATNRSKMLMTPPLAPFSTSTFLNQRRSLLSKGSVPFPEVFDGNKMAVVEVQPASIPLPQPDENENIALSIEMRNGSEDLIIHDSEEEECLSPATEELPTINLGRFVFAGEEKYHKQLTNDDRWKT
jgi:exonuclease-1